MKHTVKAISLVLALSLSMFIIGCENSSSSSSSDAPSDGGGGSVTYSLGGTWNVTITYDDDGSTEVYVFTITQDGTTLEGSSESPSESLYTLTGTILDDTVVFREDEGDDDYIYTGTIQSSSRVTGTCTYESGAWAGSFVAIKL